MTSNYAIGQEPSIAGHGKCGEREQEEHPVASASDAGSPSFPLYLLQVPSSPGGLKTGLSGLWLWRDNGDNHRREEMFVIILF